MRIFSRGSSSRNLSQEQFKFYHGTAGHDYKPGQLLTTDEAKKNAAGGGFEGTAGNLFFTSSRSLASGYAKTHINALRHGKKPVVYEVAPTGVWTPDNESTGGGPASNSTRIPTFKTKHPVRVVGKVKIK